MKIAYDPQIFRIQTYGGVSRYFCEVASRLAKQPGVEVSIVAPMHMNAYLKNVPADIAAGFRAPWVDHSKFIYTRSALNRMGVLLGDLMLRAMAPDIVHETYFTPYRSGPRHSRRVLTIYDMIHEKFASHFPGADKTAKYKALAAKRADHVICISESTQRDAIEILGLSFEKTSVIHLGFDLMKVDVTAVADAYLGPLLGSQGPMGGHGRIEDQAVHVAESRGRDDHLQRFHETKDLLLHRSLISKEIIPPKSPSGKSLFAISC